MAETLVSDDTRSSAPMPNSRFEREPASSILRQFSLTDISRYFPDYPSELARRLS